MTEEQQPEVAANTEDEFTEEEHQFAEQLEAIRLRALDKLANPGKAGVHLRQIEAQVLAQSYAYLARTVLELQSEVPTAEDESCRDMGCTLDEEHDGPCMGEDPAG